MTATFASEICDRVYVGFVANNNDRFVVLGV